MATGIHYQPGFEREQREKAKYKGRGKYKRTPNQYFLDAYARKSKEKLAGGIAFGYKQLRHERSVMYHRLRRTPYRLEIYNNTKEKWVKR